MENPTKQDALDNLAYLSIVEVADGTVLDTEFYKIVKEYISNS